MARDTVDQNGAVNKGGNKVEKSIEIPLANGFKVFIDNSDNKTTKGVLVGLINPDGFIVTDRVLTDESAEWLRKVVAQS